MVRNTATPASPLAVARRRYAAWHKVLTSGSIWGILRSDQQGQGAGSLRSETGDGGNHHQSDGEQRMKIGSQGRDGVAKCVKKQGANQQAATVHPVGEKGQHRRLDAEKSAAIGNQSANGGRIHSKRLAQVVHESRRCQHAGANGKVAGQQCPDRRGMGMVYSH